MPVVAIADAPIASSSFVGAESARFENGAWTALTTLELDSKGCTRTGSRRATFARHS
jgi:hypothetical protein